MAPFPSWCAESTATATNYFYLSPLPEVWGLAHKAAQKLVVGQKPSLVHEAALYKAGLAQVSLANNSLSKQLSERTASVL